MARRRRPGSRTSVVDGRAEIVIPAGSVLDVDGEAMSFGAIAKRLHQVTAYPTTMRPADPAVAVALDPFAWAFHLADIGYASDTHEGDTFLQAARSTGTIDVYVVDRVDPRRSSPPDIDLAARERMVVGAIVSVHAVDELQP